jgi:hypothetical protein
VRLLAAVFVMEVDSVPEAESEIVEDGDRLEPFETLGVVDSVDDIDGVNDDDHVSLTVAVVDRVEDAEDDGVLVAPSDRDAVGVVDDEAVRVVLVEATTELDADTGGVLELERVWLAPFDHDADGEGLEVDDSDVDPVRLQLGVMDTEAVEVRDTDPVRELVGLSGVSDKEEGPLAPAVLDKDRDSDPEALREPDLDAVNDTDGVKEAERVTDVGGVRDVVKEMEAEEVAVRDGETLAPIDNDEVGD